VLEVPTGERYKDTDFQLTTVAGSKNYALWSELAALGWLTALPDPVPPPGGESVALRAFAQTPEGKDAIPRLLADYVRERDQLAARISSIHNEHCLPFATALLHKVKEAGGTPNDVMILTALTVEKVVKTGFPEQNRTAAAENICHYIRLRVADPAKVV